MTYLIHFVLACLTCVHLTLGLLQKIRKSNKDKDYTHLVDQQYGLYLIQCEKTLHHFFQLLILATFITYLNTDIISTSLENT